MRQRKNHCDGECSLNAGNFNALMTKWPCCLSSTIPRSVVNAAVAVNRVIPSRIEFFFFYSTGEVVNLFNSNVMEK